jgi:hypothetical protein
MTQAEKIEDLRRDVVRIFAALREFRDTIDDDKMTFRREATKWDQYGPLINGLHQRLQRVERSLGLSEM